MHASNPPLVLRLKLTTGPRDGWPAGPPPAVPMTVARLRECTERKMRLMEATDSGLRRFVLVQACMQKVHDADDDADALVDAAGVAQRHALQPCDLVLDQAPPAHPGISSSKRRPSVRARTPAAANDGGDRSRGMVVDCRPPKKRRLKRLLGDAGCFAAAAAAAASSPGVCSVGIPRGTK